MSYHEIAERLSLPEGTVKSRINRGRSELARQYPPPARSAGRHTEDPAEYRSVRMNLTTERSQSVSVVRVNEARLTYPLLSTSPTPSLH